MKKSKPRPLEDSALHCRKFSCFLLDGFLPLGGFLADQKPAKFCPSIRERARGDAEIFMPYLSQTTSQTKTKTKKKTKTKINDSNGFELFSLND